MDKVACPMVQVMKIELRKRDPRTITQKRPQESQSFRDIKKERY
jgi:hypothetical protein